MFAISTNTVNLKVVAEEPQTRSGARLKVFNIERSITKPKFEPVLYYLRGFRWTILKDLSQNLTKRDGPKRFVREELLVVPPDTELPPS